MKGRLVAISPTDKRSTNGAVIWKCICHCGKTTFHEGYRVHNGTIKSCGCSRTSKDKQKSGLKAMYQDYKHSAWARMLSFKLSFRQFQKLTQKECFYCGQKPEKRFRKFHFTANGIDRKNNTKGYVLTNLLPCCSICNRAKGEMTFNDFMNYLRRFQ
jgi:hypothetical protein